MQIISDTSRDLVTELVTTDKYIDLIIPRGSKELLRFLKAHSKIPMIKHLDGNCHVFIDEFADLAKALKIAINSKTNRFGVCNAAETLIVSKVIACEFVPKVVNELSKKNVTVRGCDQTKKMVPNIETASEADWYEEYLGPILAIKIVSGINEAIDHINHYGSHHTDAIVSESKKNQNIFTQAVDSSSVIINASTRFADGFEYGLGAEIGISTDKIHARGPVGLEGLTSLKWVVSGDGHIK